MPLETRSWWQQATPTKYSKCVEDGLHINLPCLGLPQIVQAQVDMLFYLTAHPYQDHIHVWSTVASLQRPQQDLEEFRQRQQPQCWWKWKLHIFQAPFRLCFKWSYLVDCTVQVG